MQQSNRTTSEMLWEVTELAGGAAVMFLPMMLLAVPGILVFVVLPGLVLLAVVAAPVVVAGAILAPMYLLARLVRAGGLTSVRHGPRLPRADPRPCARRTTRRRRRARPRAWVRGHR